MPTALELRIKTPGPKKILSCDGGGILGLMSVEILARLESDLRTELGKPDLLLCDYFDFVCGTSTGAIVAACISAGMSTEQIRGFYVSSGKQMFDQASLLKRLHYSYNKEPLAKKLQAAFSDALGADTTLGSPGLRSLLMMVMRNASTDSPWPVSNNPFATYNQRDRHDCNLALPLWQLVRASTAAPTFFPPEVVTLGKGKQAYTFVFVDGGVTTYNNAAFLAYQMATAEPYRLNWKTGTDQLLIVSVGTGSAPAARPDLKPGDLWLMDNARNLPGALMNAASAGWDMACRLVGECRFGRPIDREFGDMVGAATSTGTKQFAYVRYDPDVSQTGLDALGLDHIKAADVQTLDSIDFIPQIQEVGVAYAGAHVKTAEHLRGFL
ncbi:patatin-like phospholipase family protein [Zoogloea sp.]|jgi:patatin-like phospholipase/acyl hydrolase|uniref:patatin-like phospholipase family protein n=1 Tax=Zoogloea sp. TaxID=49181 RepID=UPI0037D9972B